MSDKRVKLLSEQLNTKLAELNKPSDGRGEKRWKSWGVRAEFWSPEGKVDKNPELDEM